MSEKCFTPITQDAWRGLEKGNGIKDAHGRIWEVVRRSTTNQDLLYARCPGHDVDDLIWHNSQILEEGEWAVILELNHPSVSIV